MRTFVAVFSLWLAVLAWIAGEDPAGQGGLISPRAAELISEVTNRKLPASERDRSLSSLEHADFSRAVEIAPALLNEEDPIIRFRAAWILASGKQNLGLLTLRAMAGERTEESVMAIEALGRLRDPRSRELLRSLLEQELARFTPSGSFVWISALAFSLADYEDKRDTDLLARAITARFSSTDYVLVDALGRTGGREAIPVLDEIFSSTGKGWTVMAAGLALARCGSPKGLSYVKRWLLDSSADPDKPNESYPTNGVTDDPHGVKAADFIRNRLGVPADEVFVPELLQIVTRPQYSYRAKAQAWTALLRINPEKSRDEILSLAWKNTTYKGAVKFVVVNDEAKARTFVREFGESKDSWERARAFELRIALSASPPERRRWREVHGYSF